jgi:hypothetical protein
LRTPLPGARATIGRLGRTVHVTTPAAGQDEVADGGVPQAGPGPYHLVVAVEGRRAPPGEPPPPELPVRLEVQVVRADGSTVPPPRPGADALGAPAVPAAPEALPPEPRDPSRLPLAVAAVAGVLAGTLGGLLLGRRRRAAGPSEEGAARAGSVGRGPRIPLG